ncbi:MAG TPA: hypothetical protein VLJ86_24270 [Ramlibacter sp.]|nr:hypothetical protein [Ramlibacter sp.]
MSGGNRLPDYLEHMQLDLVWDTVQLALPELLKLLPDVRRDADLAGQSDP